MPWFYLDLCFGDLYGHGGQNEGGAEESRSGGALVVICLRHWSYHAGGTEGDWGKLKDAFVVPGPLFRRLVLLLWWEYRTVLAVQT